jgi:HD superfamily phosphodiesterase
MQDYITNTENQFLPIVSKFFEEIFSQIHLPSHDYLHHLRVWKYAKEYLKLVYEKNHRFDTNMIPSVFFACLFHDSGMSLTHDSSHGKESRKIFERFAEKFITEKIPHYEELLEAIENHDKKLDISLARLNFNSPSEILKILTICDDLDAYGAIGVIRYAEIYLIREMSPDKIPVLVMENVQHRANFFKSFTSGLPEFRKNHEFRINYILEFYSRAKDQQNSVFELLKQIRFHVINQRKNYKKLLIILEQDERYKDLSIQLNSELNLLN